MIRSSATALLNWLPIGRGFCGARGNGGKLHPGTAGITALLVDYVAENIGVPGPDREAAALALCKKVIEDWEGAPRLERPKKNQRHQGDRSPMPPPLPLPVLMRMPLSSRVARARHMLKAPF